MIYAPFYSLLIVGPIELIIDMRMQNIKEKLPLIKGS